jgi:hypothetical protein
VEVGQFGVLAYVANYTVAVASQIHQAAFHFRKQFGVQIFVSVFDNAG